MSVMLLLVLLEEQSFLASVIWDEVDTNEVGWPFPETNKVGRCFPEIIIWDEVGGLVAVASKG